MTSTQGDSSRGGPVLRSEERDARRLELLAATANDLLTVSEPKEFLQVLLDRLAAYCGLEVCFSYWVTGDHLRLAFATGVNTDVARSIEMLHFGQAVCGTVAEERCVRVAEDIQNRTDPLTEWVRSMGVQAYCCHPLIAHGKLLGTLSFGTRTRPQFIDEEIALMKAVSDQVAVALERFLFIRELRQKNVELERANEDLRQFAYAATHDLQEPGRTITSYTQLLLRSIHKKLTPDEQKIFGFITASSSQLERLMGGLLAYLRAAIKLDREPISITQPLEDALASCRALLDETGADVTANLPVILVDADRTQLGQVFQNLLSNAIKYRRESERPRIVISGITHDGHLQVSFADNGQGIDPRYHEKVFQLFKRVHRTDVPGTGIGLATTRRIIEAHDGRIWVESTSGMGTTFHFTVPLQKTSPLDRRSSLGTSRTTR